MRVTGSIIAAIGTLALSGVAQATIIDTAAGWNGRSNITAFGESNSATYGQTFRVNGSDTQLDSWTFHINDRVNPDVVDFAFYVMDWNAAATRGIGPVLYRSGDVSTTNNRGADGFEAFTFNTGGLDLISGNDYVAFISASGLFDGSIGTSAVGSRRDENAYLDGGFFWQNNGNNTSTWNTQRWSSANNFGDLAFTAKFSAGGPVSVSEPASLALCGLGLGLVGFARKKKRS